MFFSFKNFSKFAKLVEKRKTLFLIFFILFISFFVLGHDIWQKNKHCFLPREALVTKVIDGDTIVIEGGREIRLLGIDADERGYPCYESAKKKLEELVLGKKVVLEKERENVDKYGRCLRYLFLNGKNINLELVKEGEVVCRFLKDSNYKKECETLEKKARENKIGCKWGESPPLSSSKKISACSAKKHIGETVFVEGRVASVFRSKKNNVFLNFEKPYPYQCFAAVIFSSDLAKFPQDIEKLFEGKRVKIFGKIEQYKGKPEIILKSPNQIEILE